MREVEFIGVLGKCLICMVMMDGLPAEVLFANIIIWSFSVPYIDEFNEQKNQRTLRFCCIIYLVWKYGLIIEYIYLTWGVIFWNLPDYTNLVPFEWEETSSAFLFNILYWDFCSIFILPQCFWKAKNESLHFFTLTIFVERL